MKRAFTPVQAIEGQRSPAPYAARAVPPRLEVRHLTRSWAPEKRGATRELVLDDVSFAVGAGEFVAVAGPSGCGKSTLLNVIAGLQQPDGGEVLIDGDAHAPRLGHVAYMHQRDLLLPWRTVTANARLGLELEGVAIPEADRRALALAQRFGLAGVMGGYPWKLSGGMRQRVALLRAALPDRGVLLLDEPFGALDAITRADLQRWLGDALDRSDKAVVLVTHDIEEALILADRVHVMAAPPGRIAGTVEVALPRPRSPATTTDGQFIALKRELLGLLAGSRAAAR
jgi:ABC-type nitrate/sulfonate/bicarbonate transport system ATPase subunit